MKIERTILQSLVHTEEYARKVIPYLKSEYFHDKSEAVIFGLVNAYIQKYNKIPNASIISIEVANQKLALNEIEYKEVQAILVDLGNAERVKQWELSWLLDNTEKFCQDKAIYNGILESVKILNDNTGKYTRTAIPQLLQDALGVGFNNHIGLDLIADAGIWYERTHARYNRVPFDLDYLNRITKNGLKPKTLTIFMGGIGFGKSLWLCHLAGANLVLGKNVLYITLEMSEDQTAERIYANLLNIPLDTVDDIPKGVFEKKVEKLKENTPGRLVIQEYPTSGAGASNFRHLLNELRIKKNFVPDIVYIDYLNICMSNRVKYTGNMNSYTYVKMIAEEVRGLAIETNVPFVSATQVNREGFTSSDPGMENVSESFGLAATADLILAIIVSDELTKLGQYQIKQIKNRYFDINTYNKFVIGVDKSKMRLYDVEQRAQTLSPTPTSRNPDEDDTPVFDNGTQYLKGMKKPVVNYGDFT